MQVLFETRSPDATTLRHRAEARARFVMRRMAGLSPRARVCLTDLNGPRGGQDKQCRVELNMPGSAAVVVTAVAPDWIRALDKALARAAQAFWRLRRRGSAARRRAAANFASMEDSIGTLALEKSHASL